MSDETGAGGAADELRAFFDRPVLQVAPDLLGMFLEHETPDGLVVVRLAEVEAYDGPNDPGSHAYRGETPRNAVMFGPPGHVYVYFTYGMHWCMNLVCGPPGKASAVLVRAGEVVEGVELARTRRPAARSTRELARGPARLAQALDADRACNGLDACDPASPLRVRFGRRTPKSRIRRGPRVGLSNGAERPWRFWIDGDPTVSTYRPHVPRKRRTTPPVSQPAGASGTLGDESSG
ncbi:DNA-3-methyladenine glycosylase [Actinopolymorpha alba]|uniref:DNA-3-methyladenine glycosylase n=1 Tax=Actinopolymorpha alba TaxID=533267 RepID=UPI00037713E6|nr:DNA-3-methyladenine glycosylase [Actinopolymorpha alba]